MLTTASNTVDRQAPTSMPQLAAYRDYWLEESSTEPVRGNFYSRKTANEQWDWEQVKTAEGHLEHIGRTALSIQRSREVASEAQLIVALENEHKTILEHSRTLTKMANQVASKNVGKLTNRKNVANECAILSKLLTNHQRDEERILLPVILEHFDTEAVDMIRNEHAKLSEALRTLSESASKLKHAQTPRSVNALAKTAARFDALVRAQVSREENVTYWFASLRLSDGKIGAGYGHE